MLYSQLLSLFQGLSIRQIRFRFDGQPINETDTPAQVGKIWFWSYLGSSLARAMEMINNIYGLILYLSQVKFKHPVAEVIYTE